MTYESEENDKKMEEGVFLKGNLISTRRSAEDKDPTLEALAAEYNLDTESLRESLEKQVSFQIPGEKNSIENAGSSKTSFDEVFNNDDATNRTNRSNRSFDESYFRSETLSGSKKKGEMSVGLNDLRKTTTVVQMKDGMKKEDPLFLSGEVKKEKEWVDLGYGINHYGFSVPGIRVALGLFAFLSYTFLITDLSTGLNITDPTNPELTSKGLIMINGDPRPLVANNAVEWFCLALARTSAFVMYIDFILIFLTKCRALLNVLYQTPLVIWLPSEIHEIHMNSGYWIAYCTWFHTFFHLLRWGLAGNINLLYASNAGLTGFLVQFITPFITFLMMFATCKRSIPYEIRKGLHYLFYPFAIVMCWHAPISALPMAGYNSIVFGIVITIYGLDSMYVFFFMTEKTETKSFHVLIESGVQMTFTVSEAWQKRLRHGGFAYVCFPWINIYQWHAFSIFENHLNPSERQLFMNVTGDWTKSLYQTLLSRDTQRPVWVCGPWYGSFNLSEKYDNLILIASGIGIAPCLSAISARQNSSRVNVVWAVRDPYMLEFFLERMESIFGWILIYYTGKKKLPDRENVQMNIKIISGRPNFDMVIPNIVYAIESGKGLPEAYLPTQKEAMMDLIMLYIDELEEKEGWSDEKKMDGLARFVAGHGFQLAPFLSAIQVEDGHKIDISTELPQTQYAYLRKSTIVKSSPSKLSSQHSSEFLSTSRYSFRILSDKSSQTSQRVKFSSSLTSGSQEDIDQKCVEQRLLSQLDSLDKFHEGIRKRSSTNRKDSLNSIKSSFADDDSYDELPNSDMTSFLQKPSHMSDRSSLIQGNGLAHLRNMRRRSFIDSVVDVQDFKPWATESQEALDYVKNLDKRTVLDTWTMCYCGGSKAVENMLDKNSLEYKISLHKESFFW